jgi:hypothetical protein
LRSLDFFYSRKKNNLSLKKKTTKQRFIAMKVSEPLEKAGTLVNKKIRPRNIIFYINQKS